MLYEEFLGALIVSFLTFSSVLCGIFYHLWIWRRMLPSFRPHGWKANFRPIIGFLWVATCGTIATVSFAQAFSITLNGALIGGTGTGLAMVASSRAYSEIGINGMYSISRHARGNYPMWFASICIMGPLTANGLVMGILLAQELPDGSSFYAVQGFIGITVAFLGVTLGSTYASSGKITEIANAIISRSDLSTKLMAFNLREMIVGYFGFIIACFMSTQTRADSPFTAHVQLTGGILCGLTCFIVSVALKVVWKVWLPATLQQPKLSIQLLAIDTVFLLSILSGVITSITIFLRHDGITEEITPEDASQALLGYIGAATVSLLCNLASLLIICKLTVSHLILGVMDAPAHAKGALLSALFAGVLSTIGWICALIIEVRVEAQTGQVLLLIGLGVGSFSFSIASIVCGLQSNILTRAQESKSRWSTSLIDPCYLDGTPYNFQRFTTVVLDELFNEFQQGLVEEIETGISDNATLDQVIQSTIEQVLVKATEYQIDPEIGEQITSVAITLFKKRLQELSSRKNISTRRQSKASSSSVSIDAPEYQTALLDHSGRARKFSDSLTHDFPGGIPDVEN